MYPIMIRAGFALVGLGFLIYTAWKISRQWSNRTSESGRHETSERQNSQTQNCKETFADNSITNCLVCLEEFAACLLKEKLTLPCRHKFHKECISALFRYGGYSGTHCPLCRDFVSEDFIKKSGLDIYHLS